MWTLFLWMFSYVVLFGAAHLRQDRAYGETDPVCPLLSCYAEFQARGFYRPQPITPELVEECSGAAAQLQQCLKDTFQNDVNAVCQACPERTIRLGLRTNGTSIQVLENDCPQLCDSDGENKQCSELCDAIMRDMFYGRLQAHDMPRVLACDDCHQQMLKRCPTSNFHDPLQPMLLARAVLVMNGCQLPERRQGDCNVVDIYGQEACREDVNEQLTRFVACLDQDIEELPQCDGIKALHRLEINGAMREATDSCRRIQAVHRFRHENCQT